MSRRQETPVVLVVDDDPDTRMVLATLLRSEGHKVVRARDGSAALARIARMRRPAIVLLDMHMPVIDGARFVELMHRRDLGDDVQVVCMSADYDGIDPALGEILPKPIDLTRLTRLIADLSRPSRAARAQRRATNPPPMPRSRRAIVRVMDPERRDDACNSAVDLSEI